LSLHGEQAELLETIPPAVAHAIVDLHTEKQESREAREPFAFDPAGVVALGPLMERGRAILRDGVRYVVKGIIPAYGGFGVGVARAKVGKTSMGMHLMGSVGSGRPFLGCEVSKRKVLMLALEDPEDYLAVLAARALKGDEDVSFYPRSLVLDEPTLRSLASHIRHEGFGFLYVATILHAVRGLVKDENDNAGMVKVVASLKSFARELGIPVFMEAHAGKGEDQSEDADPLLSFRGATAAAAEADYVLSLKRKGGGFSTVRTLSGLGRFVEFPPITFDRDAETGELRVVDSGAGTGAAESDFQLLLLAAHGLTGTPKSAAALATAVGWTRGNGRPDKNDCRRVHRALDNRDGVDCIRTGGTGRGARVSYRISASVNEMGAVA
jgi:hypothetical protein